MTIDERVLRLLPARAAAHTMRLGLPPDVAAHVQGFAERANEMYRRDGATEPGELRDVYLFSEQLTGTLFLDVDRAIGDLLASVLGEPPERARPVRRTASRTGGGHPPDADPETSASDPPLALAERLPEEMRLELALFLASKARMPSTRASYEGLCGRFGRAMLAMYGVDSYFQVDVRQCRVYQDSLLARCALPAGAAGRLSIETVRTTRTHVEALYCWAVSEGECASNPWAGVPSLAVAREELSARGVWIPDAPPRNASDDALRQLLTHPVRPTFEAVRNRAILGVLVDFGPRRGQIVRMAIEGAEVERDGCLVMVTADGKTKAAHREAVSADTRRWLLRYLRFRRQFGLPLSGPLFSARTGEPLSPGHITHLMARMARRVGVTEPISPHRIRHAEVRRSKEQGQPDRDIQDRHGWADERMVRHYGRLYGSQRLVRDAQRGYADELVGPAAPAQDDTTAPRVIPFRAAAPTRQTRATAGPDAPPPPSGRVG